MYGEEEIPGIYFRDDHLRRLTQFRVFTGSGLSCRGLRTRVIYTIEKGFYVSFPFILSYGRQDFLWKGPTPKRLSKT